MEESDDDVQHDEDSAGQGVAPSFDKKLKHYKVFEGMPVTFSCKVHGDPKPKVGKTERHSERSNTDSENAVAIMFLLILKCLKCLISLLRFC